MKKFYKFILGGIVVVAIAAFAMFNVGLNSQSDNLSAISLRNIEVLAEESSVICTGCSESCAGFINGYPCCACCSSAKSAICDISGCRCQ
jgi:hypothetical protein